MPVTITDPIFTDENAALAHMEASRWNGEAFCPHCGSTRVRKMGGKTQAGYWLCNDCRDKFTVRTGSVMERSHVPLHKWLLAFHLMAASKKGMSSHQMMRMLGVTYKTAWFLCHRIREAMAGAAPEGPLGGPDKIVEADETYVGGKDKNRHASKRSGRAYGMINKMAVVSLVERSGNVRSFHVASVTAKSLRTVLVANVDRASWLMTDDHAGYKTVGKEFAAHSAVAHSVGEYARGKATVMHSNTAENYFSIFKRGLIGTYHHVSPQHLARYSAEFDCRYNTRKITDGLNHHDQRSRRRIKRYQPKICKPSSTISTS